MIASPADVPTERQLIREVLLEWNSIHSEDRRIVLLPIAWETHSAPLMGDRPQAIVNRQVLAGCDLLVAAFWTRLGTPTGESPSGTVEEIERHIASGKPAMLYFSAAPVRLDSVEDGQYSALRKFRSQCEKHGIIEEYGSVSEFRDKFARHPAATIIRNWGNRLAEQAPADISRLEIPRPSRGPTISNAALQLLIEAARDGNGVVLRITTASGLRIQTNKRNFVEEQNPRAEALWDGALQELRNAGLVQDKGYKGEVFGVTTLGYEMADRIATGG
jgi:hypothetical protein